MFPIHTITEVVPIEMFLEYEGTIEFPNTSIDYWIAFNREFNEMIAETATNSLEDFWNEYASEILMLISKDGQEISLDEHEQKLFWDIIGTALLNYHLEAIQQIVAEAEKAAQEESEEEGEYTVGIHNDHQLNTEQLAILNQEKFGNISLFNIMTN